MNGGDRDWVTNVEEHLLPAGLCRGATSLPDDGQGFSGGGSDGKPREQILWLRAGFPRCLVACVGGGSNSMGNVFYPFV